MKLTWIWIELMKIHIDKDNWERERDSDLRVEKGERGEGRVRQKNREKIEALE
jgi:hypothetical protein